jgi:hypothetical protein
MVITGVLLWGLSFSASSATDEPDVIYYAFVMQKHSGKDWKLPTKKINPGSYRFQIVRFENGDSPKWIALRGEFEFEWEDANNTNKGVKIKKKSTLDNIDNASCNPVTKDNSAWTAEANSDCSWKKAGQKWVQPLIDKQKYTNPRGKHDPNFIRFLIKTGVDQSWKGKNNKQYQIHRIHDLLKKNSYFSENDLKVLSRFIKPSQTAPTTDITKLKQWINTNNDFKLAGYLGVANQEHQEFYGEFLTNSLSFLDKIEEKAKKDANNLIKLANEYMEKAEKGTLSDGVTKDDAIKKAIENLAKARQANIPYLNEKIIKAEARLKHLDSSFPWKLIVAIIFVIIVGLLVFMLLIKPDKKYYSDDGDEDYDDWDRKNRTQNETPSMLNTIFDLFSRSKHNKQTQNGTSRRNQPAPHNHQSSVINKNTAPIDYVSKEDLEKIRKEVKKLLDNYLELEKLLQQSNDELKTLVKTEVRAYMNEFQNALNTKLKFYVEAYVDKLKTQGESASPTPKHQENHQLVDKTKSQKPKINEEINQIKTNLLSMRSVDEAGLDALDTNVDTCTFVTNVVANCLKLNQPVTHYQRLDSAIQQLTNDKVSLIVSKPNEYIRLEEHHVVGQQAVSKGRTNVVATLIRPGVKCGNVVRRKAEVIQIA